MSTPAAYFARQPAAFAADDALHRRDERLEALKATVGRLAHDFNNVLVPILGYVTLIRDEVPSASPAAQYATTLESAARKTEGFLDSILLSVRPHRRFNPKSTELSELIKKALLDWQNALPPGSQIEVQTSLEQGSSHLDESQWTTVLQQLLANARFAMAMGGTLNVQLSLIQVESEEALRLNVPVGPAWKLAVEDTGFGMSASTLSRACEPFFTMRISSGALGLGLTVVHSITHLHGGQLEIESVEDVGTTVTIVIPRLDSPPDDPRPLSSRQNAPSKPLVRTPATSQGKILLVEDDPLVREVIRSCLMKIQRDLHIAHDGEEGLKMFRRSPQSWALVISDITMPKMSGIELYREIVKIDPLTKVILVSGDASSEYEKHFPSPDGPRPVLVKKPFTLKAFLQIVQTHLD